MLINLSNHPFANWPPEQKDAAAVYGVIIDLPFPAVNPDGDEAYVSVLTETYLKKIEDIKKKNDDEIVVHVMGELTFVYSIVKELKKEKILCIASTTNRITTNMNEIKYSEFKFKRFRKY